MQDIISLDELFAEVKPHIAANRRLKASPSHDQTKVLPEAKYTDPANWVQGRTLALIHAETQTLLGNFTEWTHRSEAGCRRLVRTEGPTAISGTESVSGAWWVEVGPSGIPAPRRAQHLRRSAVIPVDLERLGLRCPAVEVIACLIDGLVERVELAAESQFASPEGRVVLVLPLGTNILPEMSRECKVVLRTELTIKAPA